MAGVENQLGIGMAQVTPRSQSNPMQLVDIYQQAKAGKENQRRYSDAQKSQNEKELYGIIGDTLNPRDFNTAIHGKILQAQKELAQKIKSGAPSYGDTYIMAQNKAAELGKISQQLNRADQQLALTKKEYEFDKRINSGAIEMAARNKILNDIETKGSIDESVNYFDEVANDYPEIALIDRSGYTFTDLRPEEKQPLSFNIKKRSPVGRTSAYKWEMDNVPVYYDVIQKGENEAPEVRTRTEPSGFKSEDGQDVPMLSEEAYRRFSLTPSNVLAINQRLKSQYGNGINLRSEQADKLRRIEAFKDVERNKPKPRETILQQDPIIRISTGGSGSGSASGVNVNDIYKRIDDEVTRLKDYGERRTPGNLLDGDAQSVILDFVNKGRGENDKLLIEDIRIEKSDKGDLLVFDTDGNLKTTLPKVGTNLKVQPSVKEKRAVIEAGGGVQSGKTYSFNGKNYKQSDVEAAAKKSGMSLEAYIKKAGLK